MRKLGGGDEKAETVRENLTKQSDKEIKQGTKIEQKADWDTED